MKTLQQLLERKRQASQWAPDDIVTLDVDDFCTLVEIARIGDLIDAEFRSDPTSVQCFDLHTIVRPLGETMKKLKET